MLCTRRVMIYATVLKYANMFLRCAIFQLFDVLYIVRGKQRTPECLAYPALQNHNSSQCEKCFPEPHHTHTRPVCSHVSPEIYVHYYCLVYSTV